MSLSIEEFNQLIKLKKEFKENDPIELGPHPIEWKREILSAESKDSFLLDFRRASIEVKKFTYNKRYRTAIVLLRYDSHGRHTNPPGTDDKVFNGPHVHLYRDGFDDRWAFPVSEIGLNDTPTMEAALQKILTYCNVVNAPTVQSALF